MQFDRQQLQHRLDERQQRVEQLGTQAQAGFDRYFFGRLNHLRKVRRFVVAWVLLLLLLIGGVLTQNYLLSNYYQKLQPVPGGIFQEGVYGNFTTANPLFATSAPDSTVAQLVFSGLFQTGRQGNVVGDLARSYESDARGSTYTVHLKPGLRWQDGQPLTSADVAFTYHAIQNPDAQSPLQASWQGIRVTAPDPLTVVFKLPDPLASFIYNLTTGIVPEHLLAKVTPADLRAADFNTVHPVGSGPFSWHDLQTSGDAKQTETQITLVPYQNYQGGRPKLQELIVHSYASADALAKAFSKGQLTGAQGLNAVPADARNSDSLQLHNLLMRAATMVFFKTSTGVLSDKTVRQALVQGADVPAIIKQLPYRTKAVREPLLTGQLAYDPSAAEASYDVMAARAKLDADGWQPGKNGIRSKDGKPLAFTLTVADNPEYNQVARLLQNQWRNLGADVTLQPQAPVDFQTSLLSHSYDAILYAISLGADPDEFVYWDSSQADIRSSNRLNLSEYKNQTADTSLEAGRTRLDPALRTVKYKPFLQAWQQDAPALALYQPRMLYLSNGPIYGFQEGDITKPTDRFLGVQNWEIHQAKVTQ